jgi:hypothetical protein
VKKTWNSGRVIAMSRSINPMPTCIHHASRGKLGARTLSRHSPGLFGSACLAQCFEARTEVASGWRKWIHGEALTMTELGGP